MFEPFGLERFFAEHEFNARYLLCTSDCESMPISTLLELSDNPGHALESLTKTWLGYTESRGSPILREKIAKLYKGLEAKSILVHSGAEEAILNLYMATIQPGDTVIVNWPCYQSLHEIPKSLGAHVIKWEIQRSPARWFFDPVELEQLIESAEGPDRRHGPGASFGFGSGPSPSLNARTNSGSARKFSPGPNPTTHVKMVVLNMPHNPTGALMTQEEFSRVVEICAKRGITLLVDEVYRLLELDGREPLPAACEVYENAISLSVLSKAWGLAGLRIGWLATHRSDILDRVAAVKDYNSICASAPSETLACIALDNSEKILARNKAICQNNLAHYRAFFDQHVELFSWIPPQGGSVAFPRLSATAENAPWNEADKLAHELVNDTGALILPGSLYGMEYAAHFRIGLGRAAIPQGLDVFSKWLENRRKI